MADSADIANDLVQDELDARIAVARQRPPEATATGSCLYCSEPVPKSQRWCDADCRDFWQRGRRS